MSEIELRCSWKSIRISAEQFTHQCDLGSRYSEVLNGSTYTVKSQITVQLFEDFCSYLKGAGIQITDDNFKDLSELGEEFQCTALNAQIAEYVRSKDNPSFGSSLNNNVALDELKEQMNRLQTSLEREQAKNHILEGKLRKRKLQHRELLDRFEQFSASIDAKLEQKVSDLKRSLKRDKVSVQTQALVGEDVGEDAEKEIMHYVSRIEDRLIQTEQRIATASDRKMKEVDYHISNTSAEVGNKLENVISVMVQKFNDAMSQMKARCSASDRCISQQVEEIKKLRDEKLELLSSQAKEVEVLKKRIDIFDAKMKSWRHNVPSQCTCRNKVRVFKLEKNPLDGVFAALTREYGENLVDCGVVDVTGSYSLFDFFLKCVVDPRNPFHGYNSVSEPDAWFCVDFKERRVKPYKYVLNGTNMKSWKVETSIDGKVWIEISRVQTKPSGIARIHEVDSVEECRYIKITQIGRNISGGKTLVCGYFEVFGELTEPPYLALDRLNHEISELKKEISVVSSRRFVYETGHEWDGLFTWISNHYCSNGSEIGVVTVTAREDPNNKVGVVTDPHYTNAHYVSNDERGAWICFDLGENRIIPTHYTLQAPKLRQWVVEASIYGDEWVVIDEREDVYSMKKNPWQHTFKVQESSCQEYRYIRIKQIGRNYDGNEIFYCSRVEFFGMVTGTLSPKVSSDIVEEVTAITEEEDKQENGDEVDMEEENQCCESNFRKCRGMFEKWEQRMMSDGMSCRETHTDPELSFPGAWVCMWECYRMIKPVMYFFSDPLDSLRSWIFEGSLDGEKWVELDRCEYLWNLGPIETDMEFKYFRLVQIGENSDGNHILCNSLSLDIRDDFPRTSCQSSIQRISYRETEDGDKIVREHNFSPVNPWCGVLASLLVKYGNNESELPVIRLDNEYPNRYLTCDFGDKIITITHYSLDVRYMDNNWILEVSMDGRKWIEIDIRRYKDYEPKQVLDEVYQNPFKVHRIEPARYVRLSSRDNDVILSKGLLELDPKGCVLETLVTKFDLFGQIKMKKPQPLAEPVEEDPVEHVLEDSAREESHEKQPSESEFAELSVGDLMRAYEAPVACDLKVIQLDHELSSSTYDGEEENCCTVEEEDDQSSSEKEEKESSSEKEEEEHEPVRLAWDRFNICGKEEKEELPLMVSSDEEEKEEEKELPVIKSDEDEEEKELSVMESSDEEEKEEELPGIKSDEDEEECHETLEPAYDKDEGLYLEEDEESSDDDHIDGANKNSADSLNRILGSESCVSSAKGEGIGTRVEDIEGMLADMEEDFCDISELIEELEESM